MAPVERRLADSCALMTAREPAPVKFSTVLPM